MFKPPDWQWAQAGDFGWWLFGPWQDVLLGPDGLRLAQWRNEGRLTTIKSGPHRVVYRVDLPEGAVFVKHYLVPDFRAMLRQWFRRGKGRNEGKRSRDLASIGIPTFSPIALGERRKRNFLFENYLITRELSGTMPLDEFVERRLPILPEPRRSRLRQRLADELGVMTARLHEAGLLHIDFHPGNILVRLRPDETPELMMIDLDALRNCRRMSWPRAQQNLALLDHFFWLRSSRSDRLRFLKTYLKNRSLPAPEIRRFARGIETSTRTWAERLWRRWAKRCRSTNKYFVRFSGPGGWGVASRDLDPVEVESIKSDPDGPFRRPETLLLKESRTTTVAETTMTVRGRQTRVIYKRFNRKKWLDPLLTLLRPSRAWRSWQAGQHLASRGIPTPQNLAFLARTRSLFFGSRRGRLPHETYLITLKEESVSTLADHVRKTLPRLSPAEQTAEVRRLGLALARLVRRLHERSLSHRDLKASNILVRHNPCADEDFLSLIDLVGVRLHTPVPFGRRIQNLARLSLSLADVPGRSRTETLRFLRAYQPWGLTPLGNWKVLWRETEQAIESKQKRNQRRGRPLS